MRVSINLEGGNGSKYGNVFFENEEANGWRAVTYSGDLSTGLSIMDAGEPNKFTNYAILNSPSGRIARLPMNNVGSVPEGRTKAPKGVNIADADHRFIMLHPVKLLPEEMKPAAEKKSAPAPAPLLSLGYEPVQGFKTADGQMFATEEAAGIHARYLDRQSILMQLSGYMVEAVTETAADAMTIKCEGYTLYIRAVEVSGVPALSFAVEHQK